MRASAYSAAVQGVIWKQVERNRVSVARPLLSVDCIERGIPSKPMRRRITAPNRLNFMPPDSSKKAQSPRCCRPNDLTQRVYTKVRPRRRTSSSSALLEQSLRITRLVGGIVNGLPRGVDGVGLGENVRKPCSGRARRPRSSLTERPAWSCSPTFAITPGVGPFVDRHLR